MNKSESIAELTKALVKVQAELKPAVKDAKNPFFKSNYADINSVWDSCRDLLTENGLAVIQTTAPAEHAVIVETILAHTSGEWISGELMLPLTKSDAQGVGSAITYGRRYGLAAIVGIVADEDDDGNAASPRKAEAQNGKAIPMAADAQIEQIRALCNAKGVNPKEFMQASYPKAKSSADLSFDEAAELIKKLAAI